MLRQKNRQQKRGKTEQPATFRPAEFGFSYRPGEGWAFEGNIMRRLQQELTDPQRCAMLLQELATTLGVKKVCVMPNVQQPALLVAATSGDPIAITTSLRSTRSSIATLALEAAQKGWDVTFYENVSHTGTDCVVMTLV